MFYLFNRVHLKPDALYVPKNDQIVLTGQMYLPLLCDSEIEDLSFALGKRVINFSSYAQMIKEKFQGSEDEFLKFLIDYQSERTLEIHLNNQELLGFLIKWYKTILVNMPVEEAYQFFTLCYRRADDHFADCQDFARSLPSFEVFETLWSKAVVFSVNEELHTWLQNNVALEFRLATYYETYDETIKDSLAERLRTIVLKTHLQALCDVRKTMLQRFGWQPKNSNGLFDIPEHLEANPQHKFLFDPAVTPDNLNYVLQKYKIDDLRDAYHREVVLAQGPSMKRFVEHSSFLDPHLTLDQIVEFELKSPFNRVFLGQYDYKSSVNQHVLNQVLNAIRDSDVRTLDFYALW